jgi:hypothetical protein
MYGSVIICIVIIANVKFAKYSIIHAAEFLFIVFVCLSEGFPRKNDGINSVMSVLRGSPCIGSKHILV